MGTQHNASLVVAVVALVCTTGSGTAHAQHCPVPGLSEPRQIGLNMGLTAEFATYRTTRYEGEYEGLTLVVGWEHRWVRIGVALPAYRLTRNGPETSGLGDALVEVRVPFARAEGETWVGGAVVASTLPSGDQTRDLGMGHVMFMPGFWTALRTEQVFVSAQVLYGRALASGTSAHHRGGGPGPIVNPMNTSEIDLALVEER